MSADLLRNRVTISRNIYESLSTIFHVSRISGICPYGVVRNVNGVTLVWSKKILAYSYISTCFLVCSSIYGLVENYKIKEIRNIRLRTIAGLVCSLSEDVFLLFSCLLGTILTPFCRRYFWKYLNCLHQVRIPFSILLDIDKIDLLLPPKNLNQDKYSRVTLIALTVTLTILGIDIALWSNIVSKDKSLISYLLHALPFYVTYISQMTIQLHFWMLVHLVKTRLTSLNMKLMGLLQEVETYNSFSRNNEYMNKKLVRVISHNDSLKRNNDSDGMVTGESIRKRVKNIMDIHSLLSKAVAATNNYFGINVLVLLVVCLMHLLITPYVLYLQLRETKNQIFVASQMMWLICHITKLMFIIEPCQACKTQVQFTVSAVCKLLRFETCRAVKDQLQLLLVQLDRCKIQFTACSLVAIDRTLLTTVTGTVTTYLVILFQFE